MARLVHIIPNKTYATEANAIKAVEKKFPESDNDGLNYFIQKSFDGRFFPVFVGMRAIQAITLTNHFNCIG